MSDTKTPMVKVNNSIQTTMIRLRGQGKIDNIMGEKSIPKLDDPLFATWDAKNSMVMTWLVNSIVEDISCNYMCYSMAKELWDSVTQIIWQDLDLFDSYEWKSANDQKHYRKTVKDGHIYKFLAGFSVEFDKEESRRNIMIGKIGSFELVTEQTARKASDHSNKKHEKPQVWYDLAQLQCVAARSPFLTQLGLNAWLPGEGKLKP
ncbi:uncharacterized protein E5676_scaffold506G001230 [Cucumis melo var. makuwa]|uniref:Retrotransposon Copia-like N-terminal domain-containing protein n=1 Tax=Cucumis melo var. makuwa TaxID=1194695 RepID=A0A5D3BF30_CUCMM|nr:uncharacterized protein E6C27_scaffold270G002140 [Cucumis melo var. makuwa]TYJ97055.1 uncharacterized protein E5676_scaffold506G001230 [Cucumis melo var. makuwa]